MHEIVAPIIYALELELKTLNDTTNTKTNKKFKLFDALNTDGAIEAHAYWLFDSIMKQLVLFYT